MAIISRNMRLALFISLLWHLLCISFVSVVYVPVGFQPRGHGSINFLGALFNQTRPPEETVGSVRDDLLKLPTEAELQIENNPFNPHHSIIENKQIIDSDYLFDIDVERKRLFSSLRPEINAKSTSWQREVIFKPRPPNYPEWARGEFSANHLVFRIYISASGLVEELICLQASGNPELDASLARYIEKWHFVPSLDQQGNWQLVRIGLTE